MLTWSYRGKEFWNDHSIWIRNDGPGPGQPWALRAPLGNLDAYISAVNRLPLLTPEEEQSAARALRNDNDLDAAGRLVMSHLRLVVSISRQYLGWPAPRRS